MFARRRKQTHNDYTSSEKLSFNDDNYQGFVSCPRCFQVVRAEYAVLHPDGMQTCFDCSWDLWKVRRAMAKCNLCGAPCAHDFCCECASVTRSSKSVYRTAIDGAGKPGQNSPEDQDRSRRLFDLIKRKRGK